MTLALILLANLAFGNCEADGSRFAYAPDSLLTRGAYRYKTNLTADDYAAANWWPVTDVKPADTDTTFYTPLAWVKSAHDNEREEIEWVDSGKVDADGMPIFVPVTNIVHFTTYTISRSYAAQLKPLAIPTYSVADLFYWCKLKGKDEAVDNALKVAGWYSVAITTQMVAADNETFGAVKEAVINAGIITAAELTEALDYARID